MKRKINVLVMMMLCLLLMCTGCKPPIDEQIATMQKIYFFDETRNELIVEPLGTDFEELTTEKEKVEYIIHRLVENNSTQLVTIQNTTKIPYLQAQMSQDMEENPTVDFYFSEDYMKLTPVQKIGMRASIVYSLSDLEFINGVNFYVGDRPLTTATGETVGTVYPSQIKMDVLDPNPATTPYTLSLYYANDEGKLEKQVRGVLVSDSAAVEKLLIEELIDGPSDSNLKATMPSDVKINEVKVAGDVCQVDLSFDTKSKFFTSDEKKELMIYSMVDSLTELPNINKVVIFLDGQRGIAFTKDIDFGDILERSEAYISQN